MPGGDLPLVVVKVGGSLFDHRTLGVGLRRWCAGREGSRLLLVPGGAGVNELMGDAETLAFLREWAGRTRYLASVCTGALVLGAAGLLKGRRAGTHWASRAFLEPFGAIPVAERVVVDGDLFTGGGVTAGIDIA